MRKRLPENRSEYQASGVIHDAVDRMHSAKWICLIASPFTDNIWQCGNCDSDEWHCAVVVRYGTRIYIFDNDFDPCITFHQKQEKQYTSLELDLCPGMRNVYYIICLIEASVTEMWITGCAGGVGLDCLPQSAVFIENVLAGNAGIEEGPMSLNNPTKYLWTPVEWMKSDFEASSGAPTLA